MYKRFSRFMTYRRFYVWRARFNYVVRIITGWRSVYALLVLGLLGCAWVMWKLSHPPVPRVHPEAARVQVRMMGEQATHNIAVAYNGSGSHKVEFTTPQEVRAAARQSVRARGVLIGVEAKQLQAEMLADIADYITVTGVCVPYLCQEVAHAVASLRLANVRAEAMNESLRPVVESPNDAALPTGIDLRRVQGPWSDAYLDVVFHAWAFHDVQEMHAQMMRHYPHREPMPWLSRLMDKPHDPRPER